MRIRVFSPGQNTTGHAAGEQPVGQQETKHKSRKRRRGATMLEYLVMLSFVLLAVIITVQKLGQVTGGMMQNSADATNKTNQPGSP